MVNDIEIARDEIWLRRINGAERMHPVSALTAIQHHTSGADQSGSGTGPDHQLRLRFGRVRYKTESVRRPDRDKVTELADTLRSFQAEVQVRRPTNSSAHVDNSGAN